MSALHTINGKPVSAAEPAPTSAAPAAAQPPAAPTTATHKPECGDVGETGEHGDLGSNAL